MGDRRPVATSIANRCGPWEIIRQYTVSEKILHIGEKLCGRQYAVSLKCVCAVEKVRRSCLNKVVFWRNQYTVFLQKSSIHSQYPKFGY